MRARLGIGVLVAMLALVVGSVMPVGAVSTQDNPDNEGDVANAGGDITQWGAEYAEDHLEFYVDVATGEDPLTAPAWTTGVSRATWFMSIPGSTRLLAVTFEVTNGGQAKVDLIQNYADAAQSICTGTFQRIVDRYVAVLPSLCFGNAYEVQLSRAALYYDAATDTNDQTAESLPLVDALVSRPGPGEWAAYSDNGIFFLRDSLTSGAGHGIRYGIGTDTPLMGDWNNDGKDTPGIFRDGQWHLRNDYAEGPGQVVFTFGQPGDIPVVGDWNDDGSDDPGVVRGATWYERDTRTNGTADRFFVYGNPGDVPVAGDWNGDGADSPGAVRGRTWFLRDLNSGGGANITFSYGDLGDTPVVGDWDVDGLTDPGVVRNGTWYLRTERTAGIGNVLPFSFGNGSTRVLSWRR